MLVLHLALEPAGVADDPHLLVWGESDRADRRPTAGLPGCGPHPFAAGHHEIWVGLSAWAPSLAPHQETFLPDGWRHTACLYLPADDHGPLPSPAFAGPRPAGRAPARPVAVPALRLHPGSLLPALASWAAGGSPPGPSAGAGVAALVEWYRTALCVWADGAAVPEVGDAVRPSRTPHWRAPLRHPTVADGLARGCALLPEAFWAARQATAVGPLQPPRRDATRMAAALLDALVHGLAVARLGGAGGHAAAPRGKGLEEAFADLHLALLGRPLPPSASVPLLSTAAGRIADWTAPLRAVGPLEPWLLRVGLEVPDPPADRDEVWAPTDGFALRLDLVRPSPRTVLPLSALQAAPAAIGAPTLGAVRRALAELPSPDLAELRSLAEARPPLPERLELTADDALRFLERGAEALARRGHEVDLPSWWQRQEPARVRLSASGVPPDGGAALGLACVVTFDWRAAVGETTLSPRVFRRLVERHSPLVRLGSRWVRVSPKELAVALRQIGRARVTAAQALRWALAEEAAEGDGPVVEVTVGGWLLDLVRAARSGRPHAPPRPDPPGLRGTLRPYQAVGFRWLAALADHGIGALLADDMGLGKTVQLIALLLDRRGRGVTDRPTLLVCPTSVLTNWQRELARFAPDLSVTVHHGQGRSRGGGLGGISGGADVVLTSYALLWRDHALLAGTAWDGVVLDEAQAVKNPRGKAAAAARALTAAYRVALTGTPVENRLTDLWSLFAFLNPGYLGSLAAFRRRFARPVERDGDPAQAAALRRLVSPLLLRRVKTDPAVVKDLPERVEIEETCLLTREQAALYQAQVDALRAALGRATGMDRRALVATALTRLKQICNHPRHFLKDRSAFTPARSGKLLRLDELLEAAVDAGDRLLVFTQYVELGELLAAHLGRRLGNRPPFLHGAVPRAERQRMVDAFQAPGGPAVFLLSLRAGGVGLNLTAANRVVHYDRWWNPAVEDQATDRAHRIGQSRRVMVHTLTCAGTLEERIARLLKDKRALAGRVIGSGEAWLTELADDELLDLVSLGPQVGAEP